MRELRHITKKQQNKRQLSKGIIAAIVVAFIIILIGAFAFLRTQGGRVSVELSPGNIYTDTREQKEQGSPEEGNNNMAEEAGEKEPAKIDDFTFYKVLNSKEGEIMPLKVEPSKPLVKPLSKSLPGMEPNAASHQDEKIDKIDREIVKKIESKDKEGIIYTVQIGALRLGKAADELAGDLRSKGFAPYISKESSSGGSHVYKVRIGKFLSIIDAQEVAAVLKREGYATYVLKIYVNE
ncbi:MAG TPA: SPOR domain-containing protein [Candidatus Brocadiales bacterium]|nr:SPOR domain-containing protein [Candidatus Brocadiales bacterium]